MASTIDSKPQQTVLQRNCGDSALTAVMRCCFFWLGVTVTWDMFQSHWLAMLIGIAAAIGARVIVIYGLLPIGSRVLPGQKLSACAYVGWVARRCIAGSSPVVSDEAHLLV